MFSKISIKPFFWIHFLLKHDFSFNTQNVLTQNAAQHQWIKLELNDKYLMGKFKIFTPFKIWKIGLFKHKLDKYVVEFFPFSVFNETNEDILACIKNELHIIIDLQINLFIENNILGSENLTLNITQNKTYIPRCKTTIKIISHPKNQFTNRIFYANFHIIEFSHNQKIILVSAIVIESTI